MGARVKAKASPAKPKAGRRGETATLGRLKRQLLVAERLRFEAARSRARAPAIDASWLSAGIAHEFNNILGAAEGHAVWALESRSPQDMVESLEVVVLACRRAAQITRALQGLTQPDEESAKLFSVNEVVRELERLWAPLCRQRGVELVTEASDALVAYGRPAQLLQILVNLVKNALEVSPEGRRVRIRATPGAKASKRARGSIEVRVSDEGPGVPEPFREAIFKPFFTSKGSLGHAVGAASSSGGGMGLGLFLSKWLAQQNGGELSLEKSGAAGTTFLLSLAT